MKKTTLSLNAAFSFYTSKVIPRKDIFISILCLILFWVGCTKKEEVRYTGTLKAIENKGLLRVITFKPEEKILPRSGSPLGFETALFFVEMGRGQN